MAKKRIVVMYGGKADEHSISCISAASALRALDTDKFEAIPVGITKDASGSSTVRIRSDGAWTKACRPWRKPQAPRTWCLKWLSDRTASSPARMTVR